MEVEDGRGLGVVAPQQQRRRVPPHVRVVRHVHLGEVEVRVRVRVG